MSEDCNTWRPGRKRDRDELFEADVYLTPPRAPKPQTQPPPINRKSAASNWDWSDPKSYAPSRRISRPVLARSEEVVVSLAQSDSATQEPKTKPEEPEEPEEPQMKLPSDCILTDTTEMLLIRQILSRLVDELSIPNDPTNHDPTILYIFRNVTYVFNQTHMSNDVLQELVTLTFTSKMLKRFRWDALRALTNRSPKC